MNLGQPSIAHVVMICAEAFGVPGSAIMGPRQDRKAADARLAVYLLAHEVDQAAFAEIGRRVGDRDHTTVRAGAQSAQRREASDPEFAQRLQAARLALVVLERSRVLDRIRTCDPIATARRVAAAPLREAPSATTLEIAAMANWIVDRIEADAPDPDPSEPAETAINEETDHAA